MQGASPLASPRLDPRGTGSTCQSGTRRVRLRNRQLGAKAIEPPFYWQCRQPRRGGTGGEELRRLRWSSPPGQGSKLKVGQGGDKEGKPPHWVQRRQGQPPTSRARPPLGTAAATPAANQPGTPPPGTSAAKPSRRPKQSSPPAREAAFNRDSGLITFSASGQQHRRTARPARRRRTAPAPSRNRTICSPPQSFPQLHR